jgi:N-dimethylarginine dimethylaminohydrolase
MATPLASGNLDRWMHLQEVLGRATKAKAQVKPKQAESKPQVKPDPNIKIEIPSLNDFPVYAMIFPHRWDTDERNNYWMKGMSEEEIDEDWAKCYRQWMCLYGWLSSDNTLVLTLPATGQFADAVYIANIGIMLCHTPEPVFVASNFKSPPRRGEEIAALDYFKSYGYKTAKCPYYFEGEADLKHVVDRTYIGAYGIRTERKALDWFSKTYDMNVIPVEMTDERNYHVDTQIFPLTAEKVIVATSLLKPEETKAIEKVAEIISVPSKIAYAGTTNCVRTMNMLLCGSSLEAMNPRGTKDEREEWEEQLGKRQFLEKVCEQNGFALVMPDISEMAKSGADLSCCVFHVNRQAYSQPIT